MSDPEKPMIDNVVSFRPPGLPKEIPPGTPDGDVLANLLVFCERLDEGMVHITSVLVMMDKRIRRLEIEARKAAASQPKPVIFNPSGARAN